MSFKFKRKESTTKALRRLCADRVEDALEYIKHCDTLDAVHSVRKEIKKLRAILQLMRSGMRRRDFQSARGDLKEAARHFGPARDAHVTFQALGLLTEHFKAQLDARQFADFKPALRRPCVEEEKRLREKRLPERVGRILRGFRKRTDGISLRDEGWTVLGPGLKESYAAGRKTWKCALADPTPVNLHEWRKRVKALGYQLGLFCPLWPEQLEAAERELKALGQQLGDDHDLFMLKRAVRDKCAPEVRPGELEVLSALIDKRQDELRRQAFSLGARFYAEKPAVFCRRLGEYWKLWRRRRARALGNKRKIQV